MSTFLSKEVRAGLNAARVESLKRASRLRVRTGEAEYPLLRLWKTGFSVEAGAVPHLRGAVDLYDGARHLSTCLIVASEEDAGEMRYDFKRQTAATDTAPTDFYRDPLAPAGLLTKG
ncbi:MAG: hypothetical protein AAGA05_13160 [Pseudomonadota bacterium]